jgi:Tol biopolymer transport system component
MYPNRLTAFLALTLLAAPAPADVAGSNGVTEIVSLDSTGQLALAYSDEPSISEDGRYVAFVSLAALLPSDANADYDVYVLDRWTGTLACASTTPGGTYGNAESESPHISADGRWVVFHTSATNFQPLDGNFASDVYRKDLLTGALVRASDAHLSPAAGNDSSSFATVSDDGRYVAFASYADDLIASDTNVSRDIFVRDMDTGLTQLVSTGILGQANSGSGGSMISGDGTHVTFDSVASNLVLFDLNGISDVFVVELGTNPVLVSRNLAAQPANGTSANPTISADGGYVAFESYANDLVAVDINGNRDVFVFDANTFTVEMGSLRSDQTQGSGADSPAISRDGGALAFQSTGFYAPFAGGFDDVYVRDLVTQETWTAGRPSGTTIEPNDKAGEPVLALGGSLVAYSSVASNMVAGDSNGVKDIFVRTMHPDPFAYCTSSTTAQGCQPSLTPNGFPSVTSGDFFTIVGDDLPNQRAGLLFYGFEGASSNPWGGATMCVAGHKKRTPLLTTGGNPPASDDCTGFLAYDMNGFAAGTLGGNPKPELSLVGQQVNVQFWGREGPSGTFLSAAVEYIVGP